TPGRRKLSGTRTVRRRRRWRVPTAVTTSPGAIMSTYQFSRRHIGLSEEAAAEMLGRLGVTSIDELIEQAVPANILDRRDLDLPAPMTEQEALAELRRIATKNQRMRSLIGLGYYGTITPPVILRNVLESPAWYTAYTPY